MPQPRYRLVDTQTTPYYHCISRCVRRAFLCGTDKLSGKNFDHRKQWILDRVKHLASVFAIDVCAYAIMSNHFHLVLHVDTEKARTWTLGEVIDRWTEIYKGPELVKRYQDGEELSRIERDALSSLVKCWGTRLSDLSWFMRCLNELIARMANAEDDCTGRFWEGRFKSQALLDEGALMACMAYVDLNPIRAGLCDSLESSDFTSIQHRLVEYRKAKIDNANQQANTWLMPLSERNQVQDSSIIPILATHYFELVDWTGRSVRSDKRGVIPAHIQPILERLQVAEENWVINIQHFGNRFYRAIGKLNSLMRFAQKSNHLWFQGCSATVNFYK